MARSDVAAPPRAKSARRPRQRPGPGQRRAGYLVAIAINGVLLYLLNGSPGWQSASFLTSATTEVIGLVNLALGASIAVNAAYLVHDPPWLRRLGDLATTVIGLAAAIRIWQVFPFSFGPGEQGWSTLARVLLIIAIAGSAIAIVVHVARLFRPGASG